MGALDRVREALTGGPRSSPGVGPYASTRDQEKARQRQEREARSAADRRTRHRASVLRNGDRGDGTKFGFEKQSRWRR
ncbi:hypothetical protein [Streptomyces sp. NPDC001165]|uniref:hypothetical protein n=1 Tax=Streptomyces sp. NPDC001165 TaxID=3364546 RepID=UPI00368AA06F